MGKTGFDLIATSQKKGYRIAMIVVIVLGLVLIGVGLLLRLGITTTVMPNRLTLVSMPGLEGIPGTYQATITQNEYFVVSTGTNGKALSQPITFTLDADAAQFLQPIPDAYSDKKPFQLVIKNNAPTNVKGTLIIRCGSMQPIRVAIAYVAK